MNIKKNGAYFCFPGWQSVAEQFHVALPIVSSADVMASGGLGKIERSVVPVGNCVHVKM